MERVEISAGFDDDGIWNKMSGDKFARMTFTLFWTQIFQRFSTCFIHQTATMLSLQQNMDDTVTTRLMMTSTETNNLDNSKQDRSSNRRMVYDFDGTNRHLLAAKFTVIPWQLRLKMSMQAACVSSELSQDPWTSIFLFLHLHSTWRLTATPSRTFSLLISLFHKVPIIFASTNLIKN